MTIAKISRPVCILGLGLIGGSLLRDLASQDIDVFGFNRSPSGAQLAVAEGFSVSTSLVDTLQRAEASGALIVLATPMPAIASLLDAIAEHAPTCGFTDVVSVKAEVYSLVCSKGMQDRYVGGHPMAGTADSGWSASMTGLYRGAAWVVTFDHAYNSPSDEWIALWIDVVKMALSVGAEVIPARVDAHDQAVARISHLPHIFAEVLAITGDNGGALALSLAAGSFRDTTRVAGSNPSLVQAMCENNRTALLKALDEALDLLSDARAHLASPENDLSLLIDSGYRSRIRFEARSGLAGGGSGFAGGGSGFAGGGSGFAGGGAPISGRPVLRLHPGAPGWLSQLEQAENLGARIDVF